MNWNVMYDAPDGQRLYCKENCSELKARVMLDLFRARYLNKDGTPKPYPNGRGMYAFTNPRLVTVWG